MKLSFRSLAVLFAFDFSLLAFIWMFAPNAVLSSWGVAFSYSVGLMSRRGSSVCRYRCHALFCKKRRAIGSPLSVGYRFCCFLPDTRWITGHAASM